MALKCGLQTVTLYENNGYLYYDGGPGYEQTEKQPGMTFMELLCAVLILMMSTALVLVGVNLALTTYRANMEASEAQVLYSTLTTVISDKLRYCGTVETAEDGTITQIFAQGIGTGSGEAFQLTEDGKVMLGGKGLLGSGAYPRDPYSEQSDHDL